MNTVESSEELWRCQTEQARIASEPPAPLWLKMLGHADWEAEKELIRDEASKDQAAH